MFRPSRRTYKPGAKSWITGLLVLLLASTSGSGQSVVQPIKIRKIDQSEAARVSFSRQIRPLLVSYCLGCHNAQDRMSHLELASVAALLKGGVKAGPAIIAGQPDESPLVEYVRGVRTPQMPSGLPPLSEDELHLIRMWIAAGAVDDSAASSGGPAAELSAPDPARAAHIIAADPNSQKVLDALLFAENSEALMILRRNLRIARLHQPPGPPPVTVPTANAIDQFIATRWKQAGLPEGARAPDLCDDVSFLRRVYLDLIGVIPTVTEAQRFLADASPDKRAKLVDQLLARGEDYAAHWTPFWEDALASSPFELQGGIPSRGNYRDWIFRSFHKNKPYDVMVAELLDPAMPGHRKAGVANVLGTPVTVAYIRNDNHNETVQSAANTAQVFLGTGMKCAGCHNHFLNKEWPQARFLAFAGLFAPRDLELIRCEKKSGEFIAARFPFDLPDAPATAPRDLESRLHRLTQLLTDPTNPRFARTIANRLWKRYFGLGLFEPADDFRIDQPASHPELLDWLADDLMRHGFDLKRTIRLILTSRTYQFAYDPKVEDHFDVAKPTEPRYFRSPSLRRLTAEQLIDSIRLAAAQSLDPRKRLYLENSSTALSQALGRAASRNEISTSRADDVAVVQALELINGEEFDHLVYDADHLSQLVGADPAQIIAQLYWMALSRSPTPQEQKAGEAFLAISGRGSAPLATLVEEVVWVDDALPEGAKAGGSAGENSWKWVAKPDFPVWSGAQAHTQDGADASRAHHSFSGASQRLRFGPNDIFFVYVYLDPASPPREILLELEQEDWEHRAYWGEDLIRAGQPNSPSRRAMGALPETGRWVRLEVAAGELGLKPDKGINGWSFGQSGGLIYWDTAGVVRRPRNRAVEPLGDVLWALFASPEFQYIR